MCLFLCQQMLEHLKALSAAPSPPPPLSFLFLLLLWFTPFVGDLIQFHGFKFCHVLRNPKNIFLATPHPPNPRPGLLHTRLMFQLPTCWALLGACWVLLAHPEKAFGFSSPLVFSSPIQSLSVSSAFAFSILGPWALLILSHPYQAVLLALAPHCDLSSITSQHLYCYHLCLDAIRAPSCIAVSSHMGCLRYACLTVRCSTDWPRWPAKIIYFIMLFSCLREWE